MKTALKATMIELSTNPLQKSSFNSCKEKMQLRQPFHVQIFADGQHVHQLLFSARVRSELQNPVQGWGVQSQVAAHVHFLPRKLSPHAPAVELRHQNL